MVSDSGVPTSTGRAWGGWDLGRRSFRRRSRLLDSSLVNSLKTNLNTAVVGRFTNNNTVAVSEVTVWVRQVLTGPKLLANVELALVVEGDFTWSDSWAHSKVVAAGTDVGGEGALFLVKSLLLGVVFKLLSKLARDTKVADTSPLVETLDATAIELRVV